MNTPESPDNTILALSPPRVSEATEPVVGAHYGVPKHVYDLKPMGLKVDIDPSLAGTVNPGDVIVLVLNGQSVASKPVNPGEENTVNTLYIPRNLLLADRLNELVYTITRGSQNIGTSTPILTLLYNAIRPGMEDRTPLDAAHSELELILPQDVIDDGIDAGRAQQGVQVCFSYPYCRAHDVIWLNCNGQDVYRTVTVAEAPAIPSAEPTTLCVMVEEAVFKRAGDHLKFTFSYTVTDQLGNGPDTDSPLSAIQTVDVDLAGNRLPAPILREILNDPTDDPGTIDLEKLGNNPLLLIVLTNDHRFLPGDTVNATYTAKVTGQPDVVVPATGVVEADEFGQKRPCVLQVANDKVIAGSVVQAKYELVRNGVVFATSKTTIAEVSGAGSVDLLPPFLVKPAVSPIDALAYPNGVTVRIEYLGALDGDKARLVEVNAPAGSPQFPLVAFNSNKRTNTVLTQAFLAARQGKDIGLRWNLNRNGGQAGKSPVVKLSVMKVEDGDPRLPVPKIDKADSADVIDLAEFEGDPHVTFTSWPFNGGGYTVVIRVIGIKPGGIAHTIPIANESLTPDEEIKGFSRSLPREQLMLLENNSTLYIETEVSFNGEITKRVIFPTSKLYTIKNAPILLSENFDGQPAAFISVGGRIVLPSMAISFLEGNGQMGITPLSSVITGPFAPIAGQSAGQLLEMHTNATGTSQRMRIEFNWSYSSVSFWCRFVQHDDISVSFFNKENDRLDHKFLANNFEPQLVTLFSSENNIRSIEIKTPRPDLITFDFFSMQRK
ncbi:hypothetical protein ACYZT7_08845 [Pseudomonas sp. RT4P38]